jgi:hypothetical protein
LHEATRLEGSTTSEALQVMRASPLAITIGIVHLLTPSRYRLSSWLRRSKRRVVRFAQIFFLDLTHSIPWNISGDEDALWLLVLCQVIRDC